MKIKEIDALNVFMCISVIIIHLTSGLVIELDHNSTWYLIFFIINKFLTYAVPAFIFLSGFKLFNRYKNDKIDVGKFLLSRFKKVVIPYILCFLVYFFFYLSQNLATWDEFLPGLFLGKLVAHFYYIIIAIQFYLLFPILLLLFKKNDKLLLVFSFICTIVLNQFLIFEYSDRFFATYIFYFVFGMYMAKYEEKEISNKSVYITSIALLIVSIFHLYLSYLMSIGEMWYRNSPIWQIVYSSLIIFVLYSVFKKINKDSVNEVVDFINPNTFNIFLYHILIINILQFVVYPHFELSIKIRFLINTLAVFASTFVYCLISNIIRKQLTKDKT